MVELAELAALSSAPPEVVEPDVVLELEPPVLLELVPSGFVVIDVPNDDDAT